MWLENKSSFMKKGSHSQKWKSPEMALTKWGRLKSPYRSQYFRLVRNTSVEHLQTIRCKRYFCLSVHLPFRKGISQVVKHNISGGKRRYFSKLMNQSSLRGEER